MLLGKSTSGNCLKWLHRPLFRGYLLTRFRNHFRQFPEVDFPRYMLSFSKAVEALAEGRRR